MPTHVPSPATRLGDARSGHVRAPFHGVVTVLVEEGQRVLAGEVLAIVEAMKLEGVLTAPRAGTVQRVALRPGDLVDGGDLVVVLS